MCTYGIHKLPNNPLDNIDPSQLQSELEQKKAYIMSLFARRADDTQVLESLFQSTKQKIYDIAE